MSGTPAAEVEVGEALARRLLAAEHPDLAARPLVPLASGWDNALFRVGEDLVLRLPRRAAAARLIEHEQRWLPVLAPGLPVAVPVPLRCGGPAAGFPWRYSLVPWIEGDTAERTPLGAGGGEALAAFFRALHRPAPAGAPANPVRGVPLAARAEAYAARTAALAAAGEPLAAPYSALWHAALAAPLDAAPTWIHGDPHPRNVLVRDGALAGVIDWGDLAAGDRASDLAGLWLLLDDAAERARARAVLPEVSAATWARARGWALLYAVIFLAVGLVDDPAFARTGRATLARLAADA